MEPDGLFLIEPRSVMFTSSMILVQLTFDLMRTFPLENTLSGYFCRGREQMICSRVRSSIWNELCSLPTNATFDSNRECEETSYIVYFIIFMNIDHY
jgi:hypothetical protein